MIKRIHPSFGIKKPREVKLIKPWLGNVAGQELLLPREIAFRLKKQKIAILKKTRNRKRDSEFRKLDRITDRAQLRDKLLKMAEEHRRRIKKCR